MGVFNDANFKIVEEAVEQDIAPVGNPAVRRVNQPGMMGIGFLSDLIDLGFSLFNKLTTIKEKIFNYFEEDDDIVDLRQTFNIGYATSYLVAAVAVVVTGVMIGAGIFPIIMAVSFALPVAALLLAGLAVAGAVAVNKINSMVQSNANDDAVSNDIVVPGNHSTFTIISELVSSKVNHVTNELKQVFGFSEDGQQEHELRPLLIDDSDEELDLNALIIDEEEAPGNLSDYSPY